MLTYWAKLADADEHTWFLNSDPTIHLYIQPEGCYEFTQIDDDGKQSWPHFESGTTPALAEAITIIWHLAGFARRLYINKVVALQDEDDVNAD